MGLTGSFLPGVSLLFGALFSYTISLLVRNGALPRCFSDELFWRLFLVSPIAVVAVADLVVSSFRPWLLPGVSGVSFCLLDKGGNSTHHD